MELRVLQYFLMAAREENITKAARLLHLTQPTLSRQLMQLEEELGTKLFKRSKHNIVLTGEGLLLKRRAQELLSLADKTKRELVKNGEVLAGEIAVGSGELRSVKYFAAWATSFRKKHPSICYEIYSGNSDNIKESIEKGILDLGILVEPVDIQKYDFVRLPIGEEWGVLVCEDSILAGKKTVRPEDLLNIPLMTTNRELAQNELANWFGDDYSRADIAVTYNLLYNVAMMVQNGLGAAFCLRLDSSYERLHFIPLEPRMETCAVVVWKKNHVLSPTVARFIEHIKKCIKSIS